MDATELYRKVLLSIAGNKLVEKLSLKYGRKLASKFIAGDTLSEALDEIEVLNRKGIMVTLDHLGEGIQALSEAAGYKEEYLRLVDGIAERKVNSNVSLKPTQMGLALDPEACFGNIRAVVSRAQKHGNFVRIDMEDSPFTQATIDIVLRLHKEGLTNVAPSSKRICTVPKTTSNGSSRRASISAWSKAPTRNPERSLSSK
ncbi:Proline dehydrogenase [Paenibacillus sp. P1XP2]|nr:Proline dehydrogenase [Paenibacillus sp. P1XP2]